MSENSGSTAVDQAVMDDFSEAEVNAVVEKSRDAWAEWCRESASGRARALTSIADALDAHAGELAELADGETSLGLERLVGEVGRTTFQARMFAEELERGELLGENVDEPVEGPPPAGHPRLLRRMVSLGPVAVFGAGNFPFAFSALGGDTVSALAAGCTVVVKTHPGHPSTSNRTVEIARGALQRAGFSVDIVQEVAGMEAGRWLVTHPLIQAVGFTGSQRAGRTLFDLAVSRPAPIPFYGELGSINPVFLSDTVVADNAEGLAGEAAASIQMGRGQFCTKPSVIVLTRHDEFLSTLARELASSTPGLLLHAQSKDAFLSSVSKVAQAPGAQLDVDPNRAEGSLVAAGLLRVSVGDFLNSPEQFLEECFGPIALLVECDSQDQFYSVIDACEGGLVATIHARPDVDADAVVGWVNRLENKMGRIVFNGWPTGLSVTPWQHHGGPYPASTSPLHTSVGLQAMMRFVRPVVLQNVDLSDWPGLVSEG